MRYAGNGNSFLIYIAVSGDIDVDVRLVHFKKHARRDKKDLIRLLAIVAAVIYRNLDTVVTTVSCP